MTDSKTPTARHICSTSLSLAACLIAACGGSGGDDTMAPTPTTVNPTLSIADATIREGDNGTTALQFTVTATANAQPPATVASASVNYATSAGTASESSDFTAASGTIQIPSGTTTVVIDIEIIGDTVEEADETFSVILSSPMNATITTDTATGTITNDDTTTVQFGLDDRPDNLTCLATDRPSDGATVSITDPYASLPGFSQPTKLLLEPGGAGRWFVLQKTGQVLTFDPGAANATQRFLDLTTTRAIRTNSEGGLLGLAFHPDYPATPEIFLSYTIDHSNPSMRHVLSRFILDDVNNPGAGTTEQVILLVDQDFDNHNGGDIAFGADGLLYFGLGDGGSGNDPRQRSQDTTRLLGSMLRIDVDGTGAGYRIPQDNPFAGNTLCGPGDNANDCPEIYAWGLRNPWRWSFDEPTGNLWLADVGQGAREEVNLIERGGNYGWRCKEGTRDTANVGDCATGGLIDPVTEYGRSDGNSITGGFVYRGSAIPALQGLYVFADYGSGRIWAARPDNQGNYTNDLLIDSSVNPTAFAIGPDDEMYFVNINGNTGQGRVRRLEPANNTGINPIADLLSNTGCTNPNDITAPYSGLLPYDLNAPFWSDDADKERFIGLPNGETIGLAGDGDFEFPVGTVIVKNFRLAGELVETRHLMRHTDGSWGGYTYEWNDTQTEATRVRGGKIADINGQAWIYPSEAQCMQCHTAAAGISLGPEIAQFNKATTYTATGRTANQLETIEHVMMFSSALPGDVNTLDMLEDPTDTTASDSDRARAYLHTNCASCHRPNGPTPSTMDLRYSTPLANTNACDAQPLEGDLGITNALLITPGNANASLIVERMRRRDSQGMPPIGSSVVDNDGVTVVADWINGLTDCN
ncbi:MAG: PQQ-dependent sugar dehydrogenase [Woeseiaceae bacterium]